MAFEDEDYIKNVIRQSCFEAMNPVTASLDDFFKGSAVSRVALG